MAKNSDSDEDETFVTLGTALEIPDNGILDIQFQFKLYIWYFTLSNRWLYLVVFISRRAICFRDIWDFSTTVDWFVYPPF